MTLEDKIAKRAARKQQQKLKACWDALFELDKDKPQPVVTQSRLQERVGQIMEANDTIPYLGALQLAKEEIAQRQWEAVVRLATNNLQRLKRFCTPSDAYYHAFNFETAEFYE